MSDYYNDNYHVLPYYILELEDRNGKKVTDKGFQELVKTESLNSAELMFRSMLFNSGCTLTLKKIEDGTEEVLAQRTE
ncbi:hypothetical protein J3A84_04960 [Proteiniclasticum sp. SCR006]|uniref:Uncharacterized protein n=1 Tax=Proteiniclasticum aestuarii TaxID=2817862 RepID=A0A939KIV6_9CLOT|nr:hypothetical protein [Proteiniclasticum aestuarii]MBO1264391.1 hypothetical protein [Proteiniclasticum aestuarii]